MLRDQSQVWSAWLGPRAAGSIGVRRWCRSGVRPEAGPGGHETGVRLRLWPVAPSRRLAARIGQGACHWRHASHLQHAQAGRTLLLLDGTGAGGPRGSFRGTPIPLPVLQSKPNLFLCVPNSPCTSISLKFEFLLLRPEFCARFVSMGSRSTRLWAGEVPATVIVPRVTMRWYGHRDDHENAIHDSPPEIPLLENEYESNLVFTWSKYKKFNSYQVRWDEDREASPIPVPRVPAPRNFFYLN